MCDIIAYKVLINQFLAGELNATTFTFYLGIITGFAGWLNGGNMGDGFVRANSEMIRCNWGINDYRSFMELKDSEHTVEKENTENTCAKNGTDKTENGITLEFKNVCFRYPGAKQDVIIIAKVSPN